MLSYVVSVLWSRLQIGTIVTLLFESCNIHVFYFMMSISRSRKPVNECRYLVPHVLLFFSQTNYGMSVVGRWVLFSWTTSGSYHNFFLIKGRNILLAAANCYWVHLLLFIHDVLKWTAKSMVWIITLKGAYRS